MSLTDELSETELQRHAAQEWQLSSIILMLGGVILGALASLLFLRARRGQPAWRSGDAGPGSLEPPYPVQTGPEAGSRRKPPAAPPEAPASPASSRWPAPTRYIMGVILFIAILGIFYIGRSVISMLLVAALLALFVNPLIHFLIRRLRMKKGLAVGLTYLFIAAVLLAIPVLAIPPLVKAVNFIMNIDVSGVVVRLENLIESISASLQGTPVLQPILEPLLIAASQGLSNLTATQTAQTVPQVTLTQVSLTQVGSYFGRALGTLSEVLGPSVGALATVLFTFLLSLQMVLTSDSVWAWFADLIPPAHGPEFDRIIKETQRIWTGFLRGQMLLMLVIGVVTWLGGMALGLPQALLLGILAGIFELIPSIGPVLAAIPAVIIALLFGSTYLGVGNLAFALIVVAFYVLVQLLENQLLVPRIMGDAVDLPPLIVLVGTIAGAGAYGILGALLATPVIATGNLLFRYVYRKIMEQPPPPPPPAEQPSIMDSIRGYLARWQKSPHK